MDELSEFQRTIMLAVELRDDFAQWCVDPRTLVSVGNIYARGTKLFTYYTKDGTLHADRVGTRHIIVQISWPSEEKEMTEQFPDKVALLDDGWAVRFKGCVEAARWQTKGAAEIHLSALQRGERQPQPEASQ